jgi:Protein of unknown function (DUF2480)
MDNLMVNKVAESGIITINLEEFLPKQPVVVFDLKPFLFMELILKEKDFRASLKALDVEVYRDKIVAVTCSADAIIPMWAYMLVASTLQPIATDVLLGTEAEVKNKWLLRQLLMLDTGAYLDQRVVIKGCGEEPVSEEAYLTITKRLRPVVKSIMYGEPCSTVPVFKKDKLLAKTNPDV